MKDTIRTLFSLRRAIDRTIEKVIDYYAQEEDRLAREVEEYEITDNIEACFRKFLDVFDDGVRCCHVTEIGIWVSGFYGSGKSSFTKYLGAALDPAKVIQTRPFLELLCERFTKMEIPARLRTVSKNYPTAVILLDLGAEQLAESATAPVSMVLYWKVLQWAGFSKEKKIARLEFTLDHRGQYDHFKSKYRERYGSEWEEMHNDPLIGVTRAAEIITSILPDDFPTADSFRSLRFEEARDIRDLTREIIDLCRRKTGNENILFLIDEAGQYVAPRGELILNMDGLARNLKELGKGKVWIMATGQQTLSEIVEKAALNSEELNKLKDRFPISIHLNASDIREITHRRLLAKSEEGRSLLLKRFSEHGPALVSHTRLTGTALFKGDPDAETFTRLYPFLPQHFDLLLELIRTLARSTGGIGLRSAIRVIQDVLIDKSRVLGTISTKLADREIGTLACVDDFYDTLKLDIAKVLQHVVASVDKVTQIFPDSPITQRVAKAVAALQPIETFPRTAENIAALLFQKLDSPSLLPEVKEALRLLTTEKESGLIEDPQAGGYVFLSDAVKPIREKRNKYFPNSSECLQVKTNIMKRGVAGHSLFSTQPSARLDAVKEIKAAVKLDQKLVTGGNEEIEIRLKSIDPAAWEEKRTELLLTTNSKADLKNVILLLSKKDEMVEELLSEIVRSEEILKNTDERTADRDVAQFLRSEGRLVEKNEEQAAIAMEKALMEGIFIFRGKPTPVREKGETLDAATRNILASAAKEVYPHFHLAPIRPSTDAAAKFLAVERMDRITKELDPLGLVIKSKGSPRVDVTSPALAEVLRVFLAKAAESGAGRLQGSYIQDLFSGAQYGWTKDTVRYLFAALLRAGELEFHVPGADGPIRTAGPQAVDAVKSTVAFNRIGVSPRDGKIIPEALDRAARRLENLFGNEVLPLEDHISRAVRKSVLDLLEKIGALPDRLRLLELAGEDRARKVLADATDLVKGDAGGAATILGGKECSLLDEIIWARAVFDALEGGAEADVKRARLMLNSLAEFKSLFSGPATDLLPDTDREMAEEMLGSERFHERLPDLRGIIRGLTDRIQQRYVQERKSLSEKCKNELASLESCPDWPRLLDEDRREIATRLQFDLPPSPDVINPVRSLQTLTVKQETLPSLREELQREIKRRLPARVEPEAEAEAEFNSGSGPGVRAGAGSESGSMAVPVPGTGGYGDNKVDSEAGVDSGYGADEDEEVIVPDRLLEPKVIQTMADLDNWLASLRDKLAAMLKLHKRIRIKGDK